MYLMSFLTLGFFGRNAARDLAWIDQSVSQVRR